MTSKMLLSLVALIMMLIFRVSAQQGACTSNPCANGGTCVTTATGFTCNCQPYSMGPKCEQDRDQCQDDPCPENEVCTDLLWRFECSCPEGFSGGGTEPCIEVDECKTYPCHVDALCNNLKGSHTCTCKPGYTGDGTNECTLCETCTVSPCAYLPCKNGGTCREEGESYTCDCTYKYTGDTCDSELLAPCSLLPCGNGGTCTDNADFTDYTCACVHPYTGTNCESVIPCSTAPCLNSGTCTNSGSGYTCTCTNKYTGTNCESVVQCTNSLCKNGGVCTNDGDLGTFSCTCTTGYRGPLCESASQGACAGGPCLHGDCSESNVEPGFKCSCYDGYTGYTCKHGLTPTVATTVTTTPTTTTTTTTTTLPPTTTTVAITTTASPGACAGGPCLHGDCSISNVEPGFKCSCYDGYMGYTCKQDVNECERTSYPCHAKATCSNSVGSYDCTCKAGYAGDGKSCTDVDECGTVSCPENRECMNTPGSYLCKCKPGYTKSETQNCQPNPHLGLCKATPCKNGGTCIGLVQNQPCVCIATTSGPFCEIDACTSKPCMHDGICSLDGETYRCACVGYTGDNCETEITTTTTTTTTMPPTTSAPSTITVASCSAIADNKRTNCGYSGVGKMQCEKINCCWDTSVQGVPWCFLRTVATTPPSAAKCAQAKRNGQFNCAVNFNNINGDLCTARGCCWDPLTASGPPCYYVELPYETTTTTTTTTTVPTTTTTTLPTTTVALASACASSPCVNGECSNSENQLGYICKCNNGFSGDTCEEASCSAIANNKRTNCGFSGVDKTQCEKIGCCWDTSLRGVPWCFLRIVATTPPPADKCLEAKRNGQFNCAVNFDNIDGDLCTARGCCWDPLTASGPPCYYVELPYTTTTIATTTTAAPTTTTTPPTTTLEMCGEALCDPHATCALNHTCLCNEDLGFKESDTDPTKCVARCPIGQSYDIETVACESCPLGTYGDVDLGSACNSCAANETTKTTGSVGRASCKVVCDLGSYNNDGACDLCPKATFKAVVDLEPCEPCPTGQSTSSLGSTTSTNCVDPCAPGQFISRYGEGDRCLLCPLNTFSTTGDWGECESCPPSYKTASTGATSGQQCMDPCKLTPPYCENEGICRVEPDTGIKCYCAFDKTGTRCTLPKTALLSLNPPYGPEAGGTAVTIRGRNFNATLNTAVHFGIYPCKVKSRSEDEIVCTTAPVTEDEIAFFKRVILSWSNGESKTFDNTFNYRPNPTITDIRPLKTILSGGTAMTVKGTNFYSVKNPFLAVHLLFAERTIFRSEFHCTEIDAVIMICRTPKITLSSTVKNDLGISDAQGSSRKKRETGDGALVSSTNKVHQRVRREADNNEAINERHTTAKFALLVYFDGHKVNYTEQQKTYLNVYVDPSFEPLSGLIYFRPFWPINDERIEIKAAKIPMALKHEVVVIIGNAECRKQEVYSNLIVCHPPSRRPSKGMDSMGRSLVAVKVGDLESSVGIMKYEHNLWEYPPGRSAILGGLASVIFFAIVIICCVMCCRRRRQKRKPPPPYSPPASPSGRQYETFHSNQSEAHSLHSLKFATARRFDSRRHSMHGSVQGSIASKLSGRQRRDSESDSDGDDLPRDLPV